MFDFKDITMKQVLKYIGIGILGIIFLALFLGIISFIISSIGSNFFGRSEYPTRSDTAMVAPSTPMQEKAALGGAPAPDFQVKSYTANLDSKDPKSDCDRLIAALDPTSQMENLSSSREYCSVTIKVEKGKEQDFIALLQTYTLRDLVTNVTDIGTSYSGTVDRLAELQKRLTELDSLLDTTKKQYDELWSTLKGQNVSAASIDALNKILLNKSDLISKFSKERLDLLDQIDALRKTQAAYDDELKYVSFSVQFSKHVLFDLERIREEWFSDTQSLVNTFNDTIRNLSINLVDFLLKTFNVVVYIVLGSFFVLVGGKGLYLMGRRILLGKNPKKK